MTSLASDADFWQTAAFPLPYRVFLLIGLGLLGWATNLHGLDALEVDAVTALDLRTDDSPPRLPVAQHPSVPSMAPALIRSAYQAFLGYAGICIASWLLYVWSVDGDPTRVDAYGHIPALTGLLLILLLVCPYDVFFKAERTKFVHAIRRCLFSSTQTPILFSDVVLADIGTSFVKVFGDIWLSLCMILPGNTLLDSPAQEGLLKWVMPVILSFPYAVRLRQCLIEYNLPSNESKKPLFNAIKYATAFPVIFFAAAQGIVHGEHHLFRYWLLSVFVNSAYSFWWDLTNDWGLEALRTGTEVDTDQYASKLLPQIRTPLIIRPPFSSTSTSASASEFPSASGSPVLSPSLSPTRLSFENAYPLEEKDIPRSLRKHYPWGLRPILLYPTMIYPLLATFNLVLRMSWSVRLSSHLHSAHDGSVAVFLLEVAEIVRRWLWVFIRVEWEVVKKMQDLEGPPLTERTESVSDDAMSTFEMIPASGIGSAYELQDR